MDSELVTDSVVYRYDPGASPDVLRGSEGTFSLCTFMYLYALARAQAARGRAARLREDADYANHVGLSPKRSQPPANSSATSRKPSPTWHSSMPRSH
jgi:hypothetical protein